MLALKITKFPYQLQNINNFITFLVRIQIRISVSFYYSDIKQALKIKFASNEILFFSTLQQPALLVGVGDC